MIGCSCECLTIAGSSSWLAAHSVKCAVAQQIMRACPRRTVARPIDERIEHGLQSRRPNG